MATQGPSSQAAANGPPTPGKPPLSVSPQPHHQQQQQQQSNNFEPLDKSSSNTLKRNPKMELCKTDLLKLLGYLEGELQARDIVIAALKSEKMKQLLNSRYRSGTSDPHSALARDVALIGGASGSQGNQADQLGATLEALITRQRYMKSHMANVMKNAELRHRTVIKELEEEKQKHEHDTAQGDDITYGLEKERTRLKKELEMEKQEKKRLEAEAKKLSETLEEEKNRHKQIVLILLAERKKIIIKYIEERKRSEDLAQILSEEKVRTDSMAEGLEEESKKSLHMEAEMEKQQAQFDIERSQFRQTTAMKDKKLMEQQQELDKLRAELEMLKEQQARVVLRTVGVTPPPPPAKPANLAAMPTLRTAAAPPTVKGAVLGAGTPMVSSKVVQPTATVSSVPVSGPTTGIARSVTPGQALRGVVFGTAGAPPTATTVIDGAVPAPDAATGAQTLKRVPGPVPPPTVPASVVAAVPSPAGKKPIVIPPSGVATVARGAPPPVPPNKPVVPPKKEVAAAFLRRAESSAAEQQPSSVKQFVKQNTVIANPAAQQPAAVVTDDEAKPR
ncbi:uncharacterized protein CG10915 [Nasonia vitripennis]|uniref:Cortactin-binding protein-2 N-terminal domain-containing protein n=1 Tax=Nasonia vitripennis TaxID=7425 RepID=A0A7M7G882_NASVI|nr:uncharacterized protein CG10915 [Nasonia vitripennis]